MTKPTNGLEMELYANVIRERDDALEELARLRKSLEDVVARWSTTGGADSYMWHAASEVLRAAMAPEPETVGVLLTKIQQAAENRHEPVSRQLLLETVGKLAKLLSMP